jgi:hypothetical protein
MQLPEFCTSREDTGEEDAFNAKKQTCAQKMSAGLLFRLMAAFRLR